MKLITLLAAMLMFSSQANAHTGSHADISFARIGEHLASSPYHMGLVILIIAGLAIAIPRLRRSKFLQKKADQ